MSARTHVRVPKYRLHKPTGLGVVRLSGRDLYLGPYGTPESETRYESVVAEWLKHDRRLPPKPPSPKAAPRFTVAVVLPTPPFWLPTAMRIPSRS